MSKRQLTLAEALKVSTSPKAKRPRLSGSPPPAQPAAPLASTSTTPPSTFSVDAYQQSLSKKGSEPSESDLLRLECETLDPSWLSLLKDEIRKPYFRQLKEFLWKEGLRGTDDKDSKGKLTVFPPGQTSRLIAFPDPTLTCSPWSTARDVYSWSRYTPLENVKVMILGQSVLTCIQFVLDCCADVTVILVRAASRQGSLSR